MVFAEVAAAAAAKSLQSCITLCDRPHRWQPTRLPRPWDSPGKNTGVGCHFLLQRMRVKTVSLFKMERWASLGVLQRAWASSWNDCGTTWFFSSCGGPSWVGCLEERVM